MDQLNAMLSEAILSRRKLLNMSIEDAGKKLSIKPEIIQIAEIRPVALPAKTLVAIMRAYGGLDQELLKICFLNF